MDKNLNKYIVVGANPLRAYTGTVTYSGLTLLGSFDSESDAEECINDNYDNCGGLLAMFKIKTNV